MANLILKGVREGNLKNISLALPREKLIVLTGVSGSGKSTLAMDTIYQECQRQYLEAMNFQGIQKPKIEYMKNGSPAIMITQQSYHKNPRSSVGTMTDIYTDLRMIYEKLGKRVCPHCHNEIYASDCPEEVVKKDDDFEVFMYCNLCNHRMKKITRGCFSYNTREGACQTCQGLGEVMSLREERVIEESLSLEDGAVSYWEKRYKEYQIDIFYRACQLYGCPLAAHTPVTSFTKIQKTLLCYGVGSDEVRMLCPTITSPKTVSDGKFEGVYTILWRRISEKKTVPKQYQDFITKKTCPDCHGERLHEQSRSITVMDTMLPQISSKTLVEVQAWIQQLEESLCEDKEQQVDVYLADMKTKIHRILNVGLGYLSLDRQVMTLSGGEAQRIKLAATLDCELTGMIYILDEPTVGLHPKDTIGILQILKELRDKGNTLLVIEHDSDIIKEADYLVDIGPGAGTYGGNVVAQGSMVDVMNTPSSLTGAYLHNLYTEKLAYRTGQGEITIKEASLYNLKHIDVHIPCKTLTCITGVSGSGKSTLVFEVLAKSSAQYPHGCKSVHGLEQFESIITVEQAPMSRMKRSNVATFSGVYTEIRGIFGNLDQAKDLNLSARYFSFNVSGGRCETCEGLGYVVSNMLFFEDIEVPCPVCGGKQFHDHVLSVTFKGYSIKDVLHMEVAEICALFQEYPKVTKIVELLKDVGLGYLELGQSLTTLSGGEGQRLKLARELLQNSSHNNLYLIDEPTQGLHPKDVEDFLVLLHTLVERGNTVVVVEHNVQLIQEADWILDLGVEGGNHGGEIIAMGTPHDIKNNPASVTGQFLK